VSGEVSKNPLVPIGPATGSGISRYKVASVAIARPQRHLAE
jgi:hypothetical protein